MFQNGWGSKKANKAKYRRLNSCIYYFQQGIDGPIKIGVSANPGKRLINVQVANPYPVKLLGTHPGTEEDEIRLHEKFLAYRMNGEWFMPSAELLDHISEVLLIPREELKGVIK